LWSRHVGGGAGFFARYDLLTAEVTAICDYLQLFDLQGGACALRYHRLLAAIVADVGDLVIWWSAIR